MIDLHTHSHFSDGALSPTELITKAKALGITLLALTDHDTLSGLDEAELAASELGIRLIKGIEFSVAWRQHDLHILGLNLKVETPSLQQLVAKHKTVRLERAKAIAKQLESIGIEGALAGAKRFAHSNEITRPHFASYLIEQKKAKDMRSAFKQYLGRGKVGYVRAPWSSLAKAVTVIKEAGGLPVIAHPLRYGLTRTKLLELIADFKACGGQGMEVISGLTSVRERETLLSLCRTHDLLGSVGSDFHSELVKPFCFGQLPTLNTSLACVWDHFV